MKSVWEFIQMHMNYVCTVFTFVVKPIMQNLYSLRCKHFLITRTYTVSMYLISDLDFLKFIYFFG